MLASSVLSANTGEKLFDAHCSKCHATILGMTNDGGYENEYITPAPYVANLVSKLKKETTSAEEFTQFIKEYIENPNKRKSLYGKKAIKKFGLMPSLKGLMSNAEMDKLIDYLYSYNDKKITKNEKPTKAEKTVSNEEKLFDTHCSKCHATILGMTNDGGYENKYITPAPYVAELINKLKKEIQTKDEFIKFIKDYIQNPDKRKSIYGKKAIKKFGLMPSLKGSMSDEEASGLANYLYEKYNQ
jgi:cytochrome c5